MINIMIILTVSIISPCGAPIVMFVNIQHSILNAANRCKISGSGNLTNAFVQNDNLIHLKQHSHAICDKKN